MTKRSSRLALPHAFDRIRARRRRRGLALALLGLSGGGLLAAGSASGEADASSVESTIAGGRETARDDVRYGRDIRPLLSDRCFLCHGPDEETRAMGLRLDVRADAVADRGGVAAIVPGDAEASELWQRINAAHADEVMPPPEAARRPITAAERELIRRWIDAGAVYEDHWAFDAPVRPPVPGADADWARNDVDRGHDDERIEIDRRQKDLEGILAHVGGQAAPDAGEVVAAAGADGRDRSEEERQRTRGRLPVLSRTDRH